MAERILMPLDGSKIGEAALSYMDQLISKMAPGENVTIILFHVITTLRHSIRYQGGGAVSVPYTEEELAALKNEAAAYLKRVSQRLQSSKIEVDCHVVTNESAAEAILEAEKEVGADLVAMATHGRGGLSRFALGSVADKVMRGGNVPVLMVRTNEE